MRNLMRFALAAASAVVCACVAPGVRAQTVDYTLDFGKPNAHLLEVSIRAGGLKGSSAEFSMPAWAPGWYVINDYAKYVQEFHAAGADGKPLAWHKTDKQTWRIELGGETGVVVKYKVFGNTAGVDSMQYNDLHANIPGPTTWMYLVGGKDRADTLEIHAPSGWRVATGMKHTSEHTFSAANYDTFIDCPIEISDFAEKTFELEGSKYHLIVHDIMGKRDFSQFAADLEKTVRQLVSVHAAVVGGPHAAPFDDYYFLFHIWPQTGGGLEHLNSTQIFLGNDWDAAEFGGGPLGGELEKVEGTSHEFFHAWNVKRMRPRPLGPFDYTREVNTPSLWISEGFTDYYAGLVMARAGLAKPEDYLKIMGQTITGFERAPGRKERSLEDTSWDTWFWYVGAGRFEANDANTDFSYYTGGDIMGQLLDLAIRNATHNQKSLDDWMRLMYQRYALPKPGFLPEDAVRAASDVAGTDMSDFFRRYVSGKEVPPYETFFGYAGVAVEKKVDAQKPWMGVSTRNIDGHAVVTNIVPGSPAEMSGLDRDEAILTVNGASVDMAGYRRAVASMKPGDKLELGVTRLGAQRTVTVIVGTDPNAAYTLKMMEHPTELQEQIFKGMLGLK